MHCYHLVSQYVQVPFPIKFHACYTFFWSPLCVVSSKYVEIVPYYCIKSMLSIQQSKKLVCLLHVCHCIVKHCDEAKDRLLIAVLVLNTPLEQGTNT